MILSCAMTVATIAGSVREFDFVVIGAGSGGAVVARRLAERSGATVALLEAGSPYRHALDVPLLGLWLWLRSPRRFAWYRQTEPQPGLENRRIWWPSGRMVGGSSAINAMIYVRGHPASFDRWREHGVSDWGWADMLPYFLRAEHQERGASPAHGVGGPLHVSDSRFQYPLAQAFLEGCAEAGIPRTADFNGTQAEGAGFFQVTQRGGRRASTATTYLQRARRPAGLTIVTGATATRIAIERGRAVGVEYVADGRRTIVRARQEVIVCAGTVKSPHLLLMSGIGPPRELGSLGIPVVQDLPGVGANLRDQPRVSVVHRVSAQQVPGVRDVAVDTLRYAWSGHGMFASNVCDVGAIVRSDPARAVPDLRIVFRWRVMPERREPLVDFEVSLLDPDSRGRIGLLTRKVLADPSIDPRYLDRESDLERLVKGVEWARAIAATPTCWAGGIGAEVLPGRDADRGAVIRHIRTHAESAFHPVGTCRLGADPMAVVDSRLRVHGIEALRVTDASVMPTTVAGNSNAAVIAIAERAADFILGDGV